MIASTFVIIVYYVSMITRSGWSLRVWILETTQPYRIWSRLGRSTTFLTWVVCTRNLCLLSFWIQLGLSRIHEIDYFRNKNKTTTKVMGINLLFFLQGSQPGSTPIHMNNGAMSSGRNQPIRTNGVVGTTEWQFPNCWIGWSWMPNLFYLVVHTCIH